MLDVGVLRYENLLFYLMCKLLESTGVVLEIFVVIGVIQLKIGDDSIIEIKIKKVSSIFAGFNDEIIFLYIFKRLVL